MDLLQEATEVPVTEVADVGDAENVNIHGPNLAQTESANFTKIARRSSITLQIVQHNITCVHDIRNK